MDQSDQKKTTEYFSFWKTQNRITLFSLISILLLSVIFAIAALMLPALGTGEMVAFIILIPALSCFGIATCHSSNLESEKALRAYRKLKVRLSETEGSQITLDRFFSISSDLMAIAGQDGHLKKVSKSLVRTLGYTEDTLLSTPFFDFIHPDDKDATRKNIEVLNMGMRSVGFENRYRSIDGNYRTLSWSAAADLELGVRFASARDVTDERNFKIRIQQILDSAPFLLMVKDTEDVITSCNEAFSKFLGLPRTAIIGKSPKNFLNEVSIATDLEKEKEVLSNQRPVTFEELYLIDGVAEKHLSTIFPIHDQTGTLVSLGKVSWKIA
ncbi:MAG: PAS domain-containing protein [Bdellovibrio sp.]|nr:PAS domain-containing protein [Bdellovibrio sp.]